jgi:hypothetical protein
MFTNFCLTCTSKDGLISRSRQSLCEPIALGGFSYGFETSSSSYRDFPSRHVFSNEIASLNPSVIPPHDTLLEMCGNLDYFSIDGRMPSTSKRPYWLPIPLTQATLPLNLLLSPWGC